MALADLKSGKFKFSREAAGVSLNPTKIRSHVIDKDLPIKSMH